MEYWTAFTIGLLGSFHCIGMCGPIALAIPLKQTGWLNRAGGSLIYNIGRITTYALFGILFGYLGQGIQLAGLQQVMSITLGIAILLYFGLPYLSNQFRFSVESIGFGALGQLKKMFGTVLQSKSVGSLYLLGVLNGLLPCGLVYLAIAGAIASSAPESGALYMALFGLGTLPFMLVLPLVGQFINLSVRNKMKAWTPVFIVVFAVLFVLRGMNLGIPYLSPKFTADKTEVESCCHSVE